MRTRGVFLKSAKQFQSWYHLVELHIQTLVSHFSHWRHSQYCQWTVGHYLLYFKVLLWTSLMCFKIVSFHWLCKDLQGTKFICIHLHCSCLNVRSSPVWCVHTSSTGKRQTDEKKMQWHGMTAPKRADLGQCRVNRRTQKEPLDCVMSYEPDPE